MGSKGIVASSAALGVLLQQGIGDTIRISLTPEPNGDRTLEVKVAQELLQTHGLPRLRAAGRRLPRLRAHHLDHLPGACPRHPGLHPRPRCPEWKRRYPGVETLTVAVMGCIVNGPGEIEARRYRHLAARHRRGAGGARVHRRQEGGDLARPRRRRRVQADGARLYRAPLRPESAATAPPRSNLSILNRVADQAHGQRDHRDVEEERHDAVQGHGTADPLRADFHVRHLRRRADGKSEIDEVPIGWLGVVGKIRPPPVVSCSA